MKPSDLIVQVEPPPGYSVCEALKTATSNKNQSHIEDALRYASVLGFSKDCLPMLNQLITQKWHQSHEEIARALQDFGDPTSIEQVGQAAELNLEYLAYNDGYALIDKCCWVLHAIGTDAAVEKLRQLASSRNPVVVERATHRLTQMGRRP